MPTVPRMYRLLALPLMLICIVAAGTLVSTPAANASSQMRTNKIHRAVTVALHQVGDRYAYGGAGPSSFDCSGLLNYSFRKAGFKHMPRTSSAQAAWLHKVKKRNLQRGDLMFFYDGGGVYHAAIFLKRNKRGTVVMIDSQRPGTRVHRRHPWTSQWFGRTLRY